MRKRANLSPTAIMLLTALSFVLILRHDALAQNSPLWGNLQPGSYSVGFKVIREFDHTRTYLQKRDYKGAFTIGERARPLQISIWYPATKSTANSPMFFGSYVHLMAEEDSNGEVTEDRKSERERMFISAPLARGVSVETLRALMKTVTGAVKDAPPQSGSFPLIVFGQGFTYESPVTNAIICEYLASHGYVVATSPLLGTSSRQVNIDGIDLETQTRDMEFVFSRARSLPNTDPNRLGLVGFDLGGMSALLLQMRNTDVDALVCLDSGIYLEHNLKLLKASPHYDPTKLRVPLMLATVTTPENTARGAREDFSLFESAKYASTYLLRFRGMEHEHFTSLSVLENIVPDFTGASQGNSKLSYELLSQYVKNFLDAFVKGERSGLAIPDGKPDEYLKPEVSLTVERKIGSPAPPTEEQFVNLILSEGMEKALRMHREVKARFPDHVLFKEETLNRLGYEFLYRRGRPEVALEIFKLNVVSFPQSFNVYDSLAETYLVNGNRERAILNYKKSLELNPNNTNAAARLKELESK